MCISDPISGIKKQNSKKNSPLVVALLIQGLCD